MTELQLIGLGTWGSNHADWPQFRAGIRNGNWPDEVKLQPELIPPRERRRAPQLVKMAIEVMDQARRMAALEPDDVAVVFSSAMGDMQITDYLCKALAQTPKLVSPTKFHNSVHNAAPGYWSIATGAFCPASAVSAYEFTATMALLEACIQASEERTPVLCVTQEVAAPAALFDTCPVDAPFSAAFLLAPVGFSEAPLANLRVGVEQESVAWPPTEASLDALPANMGAGLLPLLMTFARDGAADLRLPISADMHLSVCLETCTT